MSTKWRRFEVLLPLKKNSGEEISNKLIAEAVDEVRRQFGGVRYQSRHIEGQWQHEDTLDVDELSCLIVDVEDSAGNRRWMKKYKAKWKERLEQLELWMVSYRIDVE